MLTTELDALQISPEIERSSKFGEIDYNEILKKHEVYYKSMPPYYVIGELTKIQGWILEISVTKPEILQLIEKVVPELIDMKVTFKIIQNSDLAFKLLSGLLLYTELGKVICVYVENEADLVPTAKRLIMLTQGFKCPDIPTDHHLGACIYTRYGSFKGIIKTNLSGRSDRFIYDSNNTLVPDEMTVPFNLPHKIKWPYNDIIPYKKKVKHKLFNGIYKPIVTIKSDSKGDVIKAIYQKSFLKINWCIIKEGKKCMSVDDDGRDITDRLLWQNELYKELNQSVPMPQIFDIFQQGGNTYLAMEYIKGISLDSLIEPLFGSLTWSNLPSPNKKLLLDYFLRVCAIINVLHEKGYVHRDITPYNFIVDGHNRIYLIDMELCYNKVKQMPSPPFSLGTYGFMSPQQKAIEIPSFQEDIYAIGALLLLFLTNLLPGKFDVTNLINLENDIFFLTGSKHLSALITSCLSNAPNERPTLATIINIVSEYKESINESLTSENKGFQKYSFDDLMKVTESALNGLTKPRMLTPEGWWASKKKVNKIITGNEQVGISCYCGIDEGISGVLLTFALAKKIGFDISNHQATCLHNWEYLLNKYLKSTVIIPGGLYAGSAAIGFALAKCIESEILLSNEENFNLLSNVFSKQIEGLDVASGHAGKVIAILATNLGQSFPNQKQVLENSIDIILNTQKKDGSWDTGSESKKSITGFSNGVAGIGYALLKYLENNGKNESVLRGVMSSLNWLEKNSIKQGGTCYWTTLAEGKNIDPWFGNGITGIALLFLKAFEITGEIKYKTIAEATLNTHPVNLVSREFSYINGVAGIGDVYLEAARILKSESWQTRARWISDIFMHTCVKRSSNEGHWQVSSFGSYTTADLLIGNSGIVYFLLRCSAQEKLINTALF